MLKESAFMPLALLPLVEMLHVMKHIRIQVLVSDKSRMWLYYRGNRNECVY
jgi:hypothetical protein